MSIHPEQHPLDGKLEPETKDCFNDRAPLYSIAISLKRIADAPSEAAARITELEHDTSLAYVAELRERAERAEAKLYRPGALRCAKCGFRLISSVLNVRSGTVSPKETTQRCPNDGAPMWRVSWEEDCRYADELWEQQVVRAERAEARCRVLQRIVDLARELVSPAGMVNRGVDRGLVVVEKADKSDPHYRLCAALDALSLSGGGGREEADRLISEGHERFVEKHGFRPESPSADPGPYPRSHDDQHSDGGRG